MLDGIDWSAMKFGLDLISTLGVFLLFIWALIKRKQKDNSDDIKALKEQNKKMDRRVQRLEDAQANLDSNQKKLEAMQSQLHKDLVAIKVDVGGLTKQVGGVERKVDLIHEFLLNSKKGD
ncbi:DUF2730 family protein [Endozoicomonas numazuensis]|uniref:Uncharacterized protein n=1 Tax=Endozoicomonas numazuensis TaxID=1137799 RepID=A0A081NL59_9GAMM|nr:DUF2730 family protein [Endozoicomonas numazuensis]KEQ19182.1 hypothetical protein GZ78_04085 [Endozoicomonas numazuensis]